MRSNESMNAPFWEIWTPNNSAKSSSSTDKRSKSVGSSPPSKPWKLLDLIRRSNSEGKDSLVLVTSTNDDIVRVEFGEEEGSERGEFRKAAGIDHESRRKTQGGTEDGGRGSGGSRRRREEEGK